MNALARFISSVRPAPLSVLLAFLTGVSRRYVCKTPNGTFWINRISNFGIRIADKEYEPEMHHAIVSNLKEGDTFIDLGANEGYFSVIASGVVGPGGRVVAVEPQGRLQKVLQRNFELNGCTNITIFRAVVANTNEDVDIHLFPSTNTGASGMHNAASYPLPKERVHSLTLAALMDAANLQHCNLAKVDVEGAEYSILQSSGDVLRSGRIGCLLIEFHPSDTPGHTREAMRQLMASYGYQLSGNGDPDIFRYLAN